jgi:hypothetical protein
MSPTFALLLFQVPQFDRVGKFDMDVKTQTTSFEHGPEQVFTTG